MCGDEREPDSGRSTVRALQALPWTQSAYVESSAIARAPVLRGNCGWGKSDRSSELAWAGSHQELLMDIVETSRRYHK